MKWVSIFLFLVVCGFQDQLIAAPLVECSNKKTKCSLNKSNGGFELAIDGNHLAIEELVNTPELLVATSSSENGHLVFIYKKNNLSGIIDINIKNLYNSTGLVQLRCKETPKNKLLERVLVSHRTN